MRADALRNLDAVLDAARTTFAERGVDVPVDDIARAAGVGIGTVYRRFPTKDALVAAVVDRGAEELSAAAQAASAAADPAPAFFGFVREAAAVMARDRAVLAIARMRDEQRADRSPAVAGLFAAVGALLRRVQEAGVVRAGITAEDLSALLSGVGQAANEGGRPSPEGLARYVAVVVDGLRAAPEAGP
jgi:AcrR family transcriptional regulator